LTKNVLLFKLELVSFVLLYIDKFQGNRGENPRLCRNCYSQTT